MAGLFGLFGGGGSVGAQAPKPVYSIEYLQKLYNQLQHIKDADEANRDALVEVIQKVTEALIWGERHDQNFFDFFCEKNMLSDFVRVIEKPTAQKTVKVQLLQTLSMMVQNIRTQTSLYYLFSNNYVNQLISTQLDWNDEEILAYYITFLKCLALRLNAETVKFFFNERSQKFPLYTEAVRFYGHHDAMVRAAVRTLTMKVYVIDDPAMRKFVLDRSSRTYFVHLACYLRELWYRLDVVSKSAATGASVDGGVPHGLQEVNEEQQDLLMYLSDVLDLGVPELGEALARHLLHYAIFPVVLGSLLASLPPSEASSSAFSGDARRRSPGGGGTACNEGSRPPLPPTVALFVLHQVLDTFRSRDLLEPLMMAMFSHPMPAESRSCCLAPPPVAPHTYRNNYLADGVSASWSPAKSSTNTPIIAATSSGTNAPDEATGFPLLESVMEASSSSTASLSEGSVRHSIYAFLGARDGLDSCSLLVAGILRLCLRHRKSLPEHLLIDAHLLAASFGDSPAKGVAAITEDEDAHVDLDGHPAEALLRIVRAMEDHGRLRVVVVQALASFSLELSAELPFEFRSLAAVSAKRAARAAALQAQSYLHGALGDGLLDVFVEEWELHRGVFPEMKEACSNVRCLLPSPHAGSVSGFPTEWALPAQRSERQHAAKTIRCLAIAQWLRKGLLEGREAAEAARLAIDDSVTKSYFDEVLPNCSSPPSQLSTAEAGNKGFEMEFAVRSSTQSDGGSDPNITPLHIAGEVADCYKEGRSFDLGRQDRIVCGVVTPEGRHTCYLVLHPFLLLVVQPDPVNHGMAAVKTLTPMRQVECQIDRGDQRTLKLGIRLPKGANCPGEALCYDPASCEQAGWRLPPEEHRNGSFFMLTLSFEDVKRCHCADLHIRKQRQEVRKLFRHRVEAYIEGLCK